MTSEKAPDLLPCPFCGSASAYFVRKGTPRYSTVVRCGLCGCTLESNESFDLGAVWNTRADLVAAKDARIAELEAALEELACRHVTSKPLWWQEIARAALSKERARQNGWSHERVVDRKGERE